MILKREVVDPRDQQKYFPPKIAPFRSVLIDLPRAVGPEHL